MNKATGSHWRWAKLFVTLLVKNAEQIKFELI